MPAFHAIVGQSPKWLILGSMPSVKSLDAGQYYAHPRNAFWPIMERVFGVSVELPYQQRLDELVTAKVAVWDVLYDCRRPGSLDSSIELRSEQANDFSAFFKSYPSISMVAFNGQAARKIFNRHCQALYAEFPAIGWFDLPSTSPAYASMTQETKARHWQTALLGAD